MADEIMTSGAFVDGKWVQAGSVRPLSLEESALSPDAPTLDLGAMTKAELEAAAADRGVTIPSGATKAEIVALMSA